MHHPTDRIAHTTAFVTPVMEPVRLMAISGAVRFLFIKKLHTMLSSANIFVSKFPSHMGNKDMFSSVLTIAP